MYGLGMPTCETVRRIDELSSFTNIILSVVTALIERGGKPETDAFLKNAYFLVHAARLGFHKYDGAR